jgi:hypothetical protein
MDHARRARASDRRHSRVSLPKTLISVLHQTSQRLPGPGAAAVGGNAAPSMQRARCNMPSNVLCCAAPERPCGWLCVRPTGPSARVCRCCCDGQRLPRVVVVVEVVVVGVGTVQMQSVPLAGPGASSQGGGHVLADDLCGDCRPALAVKFWFLVLFPIAIE